MCTENYLPEQEKENECAYCGEPCDGDFCNRQCMNAFLND